ncbi:uncharacterized protein LOC108679128 [Hyalella azteca]|uniref:Uncharacterized protein LOC108679128 n=1 Tax=Hyalella azteca TaxID=294128 RepID=A0A8B7PBZ2_HYAAZ|nr:uncharacterized protein LOC108679128 [Hyalella azteca]XP_018023202.1 uncharacterized protein LOC108679128 [Hyalella azteca]
MAQDLLYLRWKNHYTSLCSSFLQLFSSHDSKLNYDDATIACDGKLYPVHRLVLSVCSDYFADMFAATSAVGRHPIIVLKDIPSDIFEVLLKFIYIGEVNVERSKFSALVNVARCLKVSGLASYEGGGILEDASDVKPDKKRKAAATESSTEAVDVQAVGKIRRTNNDTRQKTEGPMPDQPPSLNKEEQTSTGQVVLKDTTQPSQESQRTRGRRIKMRINYEENDSSDSYIGTFEKKAPLPADQSSSVSASNILAEEDGLPPMDSPDVNLPLAYESVSDDSRDSLQVDSSETGHSLKMCSVRLSPVGSDVSKDGYVAGEDRKSKGTSRHRKFQCKLCGFRARGKGPMVLHSRTHMRQQQHKGKLSMKLHARTFLKPLAKNLSETEKSIIESGNKGETILALDSKDKSNEPKISCPLCTFHCHDSKDLDSHMSSHTPVQEEVKFSSLAATETPIVKTSVPSAVLPSPAKDPLQCILCSTHCNSESELSLHYHTHKRDDGFYCCCYCNFATRDRSNLVIHHRIHTGEKPFQCFFCTYTSRSPYGLRSHYEKESHPLQTLANCPKCPYASKESSELEEHMMYSHPEGNIPYKCPKCSFLASDRSQYIGHMRSHPPQTKSWFCVRCYYCTYDLKAFNFHVKTRHKKKNISVGQKFAWKEIEGQNTPPGEVDLGKIGANKNEALNEMSGSTSEMTSPVASFAMPKQSRVPSLANDLVIKLAKNRYKCRMCPYTKSSRQSVRAHTRRHTGEKPYACTECLYRASQSASLATHIEKHRRNLPFKCPHCSYSTRGKRLLRNHIVRNHRIDDDNIEDIPSAYGIAIESHCPDCSFRSDDRQTLLCHIEQEHPASASITSNTTFNSFYSFNSGEFSAAPEMPDNSTNDDSCVDPSELCGVVIKQEVLSDDDSSTFDVPATETRDVCESVVPQAENVDEPDATVNSIFEVAESHPFSNVQVKVIKPSLMDMVDVIDDPTFVMKTSLMTYLSVDNPANPLINKTDNNEYRCNDCFFLTPDPEIMTKHVKEYIKTKQYACDRCNFRSKYSKSIEKHKMKGKSNKLYKCPTCKLRTCCPLPTHWYPCYQAWEQSKTDEVLPYRKGRRPLEPSIFDSCYASSASEGYSMKDDVSDAASQSNGEYSLNNEVVESDDNLKVENESNSGKISDAKYKLNVIDRKAGTEEKPNDLLNNDDCASYLNALDASEKSVSSGNPEKDKHPTNLDKNFDIGANKRLESCIETSDVMALETGNIFTDHSSGFDVNSADDEENFIQCDPISVDPMDHVAEFDEDQNNEENGELETLVPLTEVSGLNQIDGMNAEPSGKKAETSKEEVSNFASMKSPLAFSFASSDVDDSLDLNSVS